jgi:putative spermidine/putrescine transport system substrate-binding protein
VTCPRLAILALVSIAILTAPLVPVPRADAQPKTLVVTGYGGRWSDVMKKALVEPFEKTHGVKVEIVTGITTEWVAKLLAAGPDNPPFDVVFGNEPPFPIPRERGFFEKRNETLAPNIKNVYPKALTGDMSVAMFWGRIGLVYRSDSGLSSSACSARSGSPRST